MTTEPAVVSTAPSPLDMRVEFDLSLSTAVDTSYRQTSEEDYATGPVTVLDLVVREVAAQVVSRFTSNDRDEMRRAFTAAIADEVRASVAPVISKMFDLPLTPTNEWGEPTGVPSSLRSLILAQAEKALELKAPSRFDRGTGSPLYELLAGVTERAMAKELADELAAARLSIRERVSNVTAEVLAATVTKALTS